MNKGNMNSVDIFEKNKRIGRGINLGNALEFEEKDWDGGQLYTWIIKEEDIDRIKNAGFDSLRIPVKWSGHALKEAPYTINKIFFNRVDEVVNYALSKGFTVILDVHHYNEMNLAPYEHIERLETIWKQLSEHYQGYPHPLYFEILNEPDDKNLTSSVWNSFISRILPVIREKNPDRAVVIGPPLWHHHKYLNELQLPEEDRNIIVGIHNYDPFEFTHQGAYWIPGIGTDKKEWEGTDSEKAFLREGLDTISTWGEEHRRPMYIGEFGCIQLADEISRAKYLSFITKEMQVRGIPWTYWDYCADFRVFDKEKGEWITSILDALTGKSNWNY